VDEYVQRVRRLTRVLFYAMAFAVIGWGFSDYPAFFGGLALGIGIGMFNTVFLAVKIDRLGARVAAGQKRSGLGMFVRLSMGALGAVIALRFPEHIGIVGLATGIISVPVLALGDAIFLNLKNKDH